MEKEGLRRQLYEEIHSQFESKLREARRQKSQLEEEMELSEEKWRNERRRLNSEIDRLESALGDAREARRKAAPAKPGKTIDPQELARIQSAADEKLHRATQDWDAERTRLKAEIARLQSGIAEMLERSNNPLRSTQQEKDKFESQLHEALRAKRQAEDALLLGKSEWEQEKLKLVAESVKARGGAAAAAVKPGKTKQDERIEQLERQLDEAIKIRDKQIRDAASSREKLETDLAKARNALDSLKESQTETMARFKVELEEARAELKIANRRADDAQASADKERAGLEKQIREAARAQEKLEADLAKAAQGGGKSSAPVDSARSQELEKAQQAITSLKASQTETMARFKVELEEARAELKLANRRVEEAKGGGDKERKELEKQLQEATKVQEKLQGELLKARQGGGGGGSSSNGDDAVSSEVVAQLRRQYDERMQDITQQKTKLSEELRNVTSLLEAERKRLGADGNSGKNSGAGASVDTARVDAEVERVQEMIAGIAKLIDNPETELSVVIRKNVERAELDAYLKGILFSIGRGDGM